MKTLALALLFFALPQNKVSAQDTPSTLAILGYKDGTLTVERDGILFTSQCTGSSNVQQGQIPPLKPMLSTCPSAIAFVGQALRDTCFDFQKTIPPGRYVCFLPKSAGIELISVNSKDAPYTIAGFDITGARIIKSVSY